MIKRKCASCGVETEYGVHAQFPFCSARCRDVDLLGWAEGKRTLSTPITDADEAMEVFLRQDADQYS
jgi:endogenous inhibitor of DNA gyrase (YacG/DUF329 family)